MKDRYAILIIVIIELIIHQLTTGPDFLTINWMIGKFLFSAGIFTILLAIIQQQNSYTFHKLFSKGLKIGVLYLILYIPLSKISSFLWVGIESANFLDHFLEDIPIMLIAFLFYGMATFAQVLIGTCLGYVIWDKLLKKAPPSEEEYF